MGAPKITNIFIKVNRPASSKPCQTNFFLLGTSMAAAAPCAVSRQAPLQVRWSDSRGLLEIWSHKLACMMAGNNSPPRAPPLCTPPPHDLRLTLLTTITFGKMIFVLFYIKYPYFFFSSLPILFFTNFPLKCHQLSILIKLWYKFLV